MTDVVEIERSGELHKLSEEKQRVVNLMDLWPTRLESWGQKELMVREFSLTDQKGKAMKVVSTGYEKPLLSGSERGWLFFAYEEEEVVGFRNSVITDANVIRVGGNIELMKHRSGVASAIEAVHMMMLQEEANKTGHPVVYTVFDVNSMRLLAKQKEVMAAEEMNEENKVEKLKEELGELEKQRQAWLRLYGEGGRLGFSHEDHYFIVGDSGSQWSVGGAEVGLGRRFEPGGMYVDSRWKVSVTGERVINVANIFTQTKEKLMSIGK